jgi:hypothetical protein
VCPFSVTTLTKINQAHGLYRRSNSIFHYYVPSCQRGFAGTARLCGRLELRWPRCPAVLRWPRCPAVLRWLRCGERLVADIAGRFHNTCDKIKSRWVYNRRAWLPDSRLCFFSNSSCIIVVRYTSTGVLPCFLMYTIYVFIVSVY